MLSVSDRAERVFEVLGLETETYAGNGRYRRSHEIGEGVVFWSTSSDRHKTDTLGVQFFGPGLDVVKRLGEGFRMRGYEERNPGTDRITFCKSVARKADGGVDVQSLTTIRAEIEALLRTPLAAAIRNASAQDFVSFMRASPLNGVELDMPERETDAGREAAF